MDKKLQQMIDRVNKSKYCFGICSNAGNNDRHVLFFDFDGDVTLSLIENSLKRTMIVYNLSDIYILKSDNGYNAFCLDMLTLDDVYDLLENTDYVCNDFIQIGYEKRGFYVLRMCYNKHYLEKIDGYKTKNALSNAHKWFFSDIMNFPINNNYYYDNNTVCKLIAYKSPKHGTVDIDD